MCDATSGVKPHVCARHFLSQHTCASRRSERDATDASEMPDRLKASRKTRDATGSTVVTLTLIRASTTAVVALRELTLVKFGAV